MSAMLTSQGELGPTDSLSGASSAQYTGGGGSGPQTLSSHQMKTQFKKINRGEAGMDAHPVSRSLFP